MKRIKRVIETIITLFLWLSYTFFALTLIILYILPLLIFFEKRKLFQNYIYIFLKISVNFTSLIVPGLKNKTYNKQEIKNIKSSIILCNHLSFVDALLVLMSNNHTVAIIRDEFFRIPFLGWILNKAGFIPVFIKEKKSKKDKDKLSKLHMDRMEGIKNTLKSGTNILIFPEGTRSTTDTVKQFKLGAFKIAKKLNAPIQLLRIRNTHKLLNRHSMIFSGFSKNTMSIEKIGTIHTSYTNHTASELKERAYKLFKENKENIKEKMREKTVKNHSLILK